MRDKEVEVENDIETDDMTVEKETHEGTEIGVVVEKDTGNAVEVEKEVGMTGMANHLSQVVD